MAAKLARQTDKCSAALIIRQRGINETVAETEPVLKYSKNTYAKQRKGSWLTTGLLEAYYRLTGGLLV
jgi:uncharacterized protein YdeI (YjbR/CyaY-like superfamily)